MNKLQECFVSFYIVDSVYGDDHAYYTDLLQN